MDSRTAQMMSEIQEAICAGLEEIDTIPFGCDRWERAGGGGGVTRVLTGGSVIEKGGVNFSDVFGQLSEEFARQIPGSGTEFRATGVSVVLHPESPHVPTVHANLRCIEHGDRIWFGGGADLTPSYFHASDKQHFHGVLKAVCERHGQDYGAYRDWCERYFYLPHRGERRGVGGIFFDSLEVSEATTAFVRDLGNSFLDAYFPIVERRRQTPVTPAQRRWQELRRGRYAEFNLLYDRGTSFGLKTGGRTQSILMSLPPRARWAYAEEPAPGTPEHALLEELRS